jgi:hypothetical protein
LPEEKTSSRKNGRPTKINQLNIKEDVQKFFSRGLTIEDICRVTGYNRKTISKYYSVLVEEIEKDQTKNFMERERDARRRTKLCYDDLLCSEYSNRDDIEERIRSETNKQVVVQLFSKRAESTRIIIDLRARIDGVEATLTAEEAVKKMKEMQKNESREQT